MCRIFGFRSIINSQVHSSLVEADNALMDQSLKHPDGWGVAYYLENTPHLVKSTNCAMDDHIFQKISGTVTSHTVVAHIRKATVGQNNILNSHPFQYGKWIFAHNGNIKDYDQHKDKLLKLVDDDLRRFILGSTDSEVFFFILLSNMRKVHPLDNPNIDLPVLFNCIEITIQKIVSIIGKLRNSTTPIPSENYLTFILSSGPIMVAFHGGQLLNFCTHKTKCPDRDFCASYAPFCEAPFAKDGLVNHLIFSSEELVGHNVWNPMLPQEVIGIDSSMRLQKRKLSGDFF